jgi:Tfp pilus assembly protein PilO
VITARDRKIISLLVPLLLVAGYWFMVLAPKRAESQKVTQELTKAQSARDTAEQQVAALNAAKASFASDYATVLRLGKAVPTTVDMPSLLVQLDSAARGTGINIGDFKPGSATDSGSPSTSSAGSTPPGGGGNPAAPGAPPAQGFPAKQAQKAGNGVSQANSTNQANADKANAGAQPGAPTSGASVPGLVSIPVTFTMTGDYFGLADFFHRMKRFVQVVNDQIVVKGRLMTIESFSFQNDDSNLTTSLKADVAATIYLSPADQGTTAGATAQGPAGAPGGAAAPAAPTGSASPSTPTAAATP